MRSYIAHRDYHLVCAVKQIGNTVTLITQANTARKRQDTFRCVTRESADRLYDSIKAMIEVLDENKSCE